MAVGKYVFALALWKRGLHRNEIAGYLPDQRALDAEYDQAYQQAKTSLTDVGAGGTSIDIDSMVEDSPDDEAYASRPWENDAFYCGEIVQMYWEGGRVPDNQSDSFCSRRYAFDYNSRKAGKPVQLGGYQ